MQLNLKNVHNLNLRCFGNSLATIIEFYGETYEYMLSDSWTFKYNKEITNQNIAYRFSLPKNKYLQNVEKYCGIKCEYVENDDYAILVKIIFNELSLCNPIMAIYDGFYCYWTDEYNIKHEDHWMIIKGINVEQQLIYCNEPNANLENIELPINVLVGKFYFFNKTIKRNAFFLSDILKDSINNIRDNISLKEEIIEFNNNLMNEIIGEFTFADDINDILIIKILDSLSRDRYCYSDFLEYMSCKFKNQNILVLSKDMQNIAAYWKTCRALLIKCFYKKDKDIRFELNKINSKLHEIAILEEKLLNKIELVSLNNNESIHNDYNQDKLKLGEDLITYSIDISSHFNNKAFATSLLNMENANVFSEAAFFINNKGLDESLCLIQGIRFKMFFGYKYDNIICKAQILELPKQKYAHIGILGNSVSNEAFDNICFNYDDDSHDEFQITFPEWWDCRSIYWKDKMVEYEVAEITKYGENKVIQNHFIFLQVFKTSNLKNIVSISLPDNSCIHIFAITGLLS